MYVGLCGNKWCEVVTASANPRLGCQHYHVAAEFSTLVIFASVSFGHSFAGNIYGSVDVEIGSVFPACILFLATI